MVLTEFEVIAEEAGWATITLHTASASMREELRGEVISRLRQVDPDAVTVDEIQSVAVVAAGVSSGIDSLLQDDHTTFLRRAHPISLGRVSQGYPYLNQLVGRLIADGMIRSAGYGLVEFALPSLREALIGPVAPVGTPDDAVEVSRPRTRRPRPRDRG